jgi:hypothetical protein
MGCAVFIRVWAFDAVGVSKELHSSIHYTPFKFARALPALRISSVSSVLNLFRAKRRAKNSRRLALDATRALQYRLDEHF